MAFFPTTKIGTADTFALDAFSRFRTCAPVTLFDSKQIIDGQPQLWAVSSSFGGAINYNRNRAATSLTASSTVNSQAIRQTKRYFDYQPGKSLRVITTFNFEAPVTGIRKRIGYFDASNGIFLEQSGFINNIVLRSAVTGTPVDTVISQSAWNIDRLDGTGPSGYKLDFSKVQILDFDMQWLGAGRIRIGFFMSGSLVYAHHINNSNSNSAVYMSSPNLPIRAEITNVGAGASGTMEKICSTVISEGGYDPKGELFSANRDSTAASTSTTAMTPLISLRLKSGDKAVTIIPQNISIVNTSGGQDYLWALFLNPAVAGSDAASWTGILSSSVEYDVSRNSSNTLTGGLQLYSGYVSKTEDNIMLSFPIDAANTIGVDVNGVSDQLVLAAKVVTGASAQNLLSAITWRELV